MTQNTVKRQTMEYPPYFYEILIDPLQPALISQDFAFADILLKILFTAHCQKLFNQKLPANPLFS